MSSKKELVYKIVMSSLFFIALTVIILNHQRNMYFIKNDYSFRLIGNEEIIVLKGEEYRDPGVKILSREGKNLFKHVNIIENINTDKIGEYEIKYDANYNSINKNLTRKVKVVEKESIDKWITIPTYDGSNQVTHPKVIYFENGYNGYKYWMVSTPYPKNNTYLENPSIAVSNNGIDWIEPDGIKNPISGYPSKVKDDSYYSDPFILHDGDKFEVFYRKTRSYLNGYYKSNGYNYMYYIASNDGITYSDPTIIMDNNPKEQYMSKSVIKENGLYKIWYVNYDGNVRYTESTDLIEFTEPINVKIDNFNQNVWHMEIQYVDNKYKCIFMTRKELFYMESDDGLNFIKPKKINTTLENMNPSIYSIYKTSFVITDKYIELFIPYRVNYIWKMKYIKVSKNDFYKDSKEIKIYDMIEK